MGKVVKWAVLGVFGLMIGCAESPAQCDENLETCEYDCAFEDGLVAAGRCLQVCDEEHYECLEAADEAAENASAFGEFLEVLFDDDDDDFDDDC